MSDQTFGLRTSKGFAAKLVLGVTGFAGSIFFARVLGPAGYGTFGTIVAAANVLDNPITGLGDACKKRINEPDVPKGEVVSMALLTAIVGGISLSIIGFGIEQLTGFFGIRNGALLLALTLVGASTFKITQQLLSGTGQFGNAVGFDMLRSVLTIPLQVGLVVLGLGVAGMVFGLTIASLVLVPILLVSIGTLPSIPTRETVESLWRYARFSVPNGFVGATYSRLDILLLNGVLGAAVAGEYKVAYQLVLPGTMLAGVMSTGLFADVSAKSSRGESIDTRVTNNIAFASLVAIPLAFGAAAMPTDLLVTVFGPQYDSAGPLLVGLGVYQVIATQNTQVTSVVTGSDRPDIGLAVDTITVVFNIVVGVIFLFEFGAVGVVSATILAALVRYGAYTHYARQFASYSPLPRPLLHQLIAGVIMFGVVELIHSWWGVRSWLDLAGIVGTGGVVYVVALLVLSEPFFIALRSVVTDAQEQYLS